MMSSVSIGKHRLNSYANWYPIRRYKVSGWMCCSIARHVKCFMRDEALWWHVAYGWHACDDVMCACMRESWCYVKTRTCHISTCTWCRTGNLDVAILHAPTAIIEHHVNAMVTAFGTQRYIANLGHGMLPSHKPEALHTFVEQTHAISEQLNNAKQ